MVALAKHVARVYRGRYAALGTVSPRGDITPKAMAIVPKQHIENVVENVDKNVNRVVDNKR